MSEHLIKVENLTKVYGMGEVAVAALAGVDEVVAQVVALETERVNQAVAGGQLEQARADEILAGLEAGVREILEQPLRLGRPGATDDASGQP